MSLLSDFTWLLRGKISFLPAESIFISMVLSFFLSILEMVFTAFNMSLISNMENIK